ncbi:MAG: coenzyme F420-0:L-glutamate ligase [Anaerolineales bacterium]|nr:coenzyme F420-0:L-glutamate ligase [Anaerolineales bacterium]MCS7248347.1 coenzyme F420-0:L-glutamate ligase [Anaerolineales bacterium]MDW8162160.1 coenzyme F420-0:L-glutamate ligase [Anaerolineales bacterium]MDW8446715.1 coenzyme F420-0:L-glutamate ligase [Anaerolineales bacterium]
MAMILTPLKGFPLVKRGDDLVELTIRALAESDIVLSEGDILVFAQKIVSKAEGRQVNLAAVTPSPRAAELAQEIEKDPRLVELILRESRAVLRTRPGTIVVEHRLGFVCANAGIDHSNVAGPGTAEEEWVLLLPEDPDASARRLREGLQAHFGVSIGVMIVDSHGRAWRLGTVGVAIGLAGVPGLVDLRGQPDLFGYRLRITQVGVGDELAAAASLVMGQAAEGTPVVHVHGFPYPLRQSRLGELIRPIEQDLFR